MATCPGPSRNLFEKISQQTEIPESPDSQSQSPTQIDRAIAQESPSSSSTTVKNQLDICQRIESPSDLARKRLRSFIKTTYPLSSKGNTRPQETGINFFNGGTEFTVSELFLWPTSPKHQYIRTKNHLLTYWEKCGKVLLVFLIMVNKDHRSKSGHNFDRKT